MIGVVNYGAGNVHAILNQYDLLNINHMVISNETDFKKDNQRNIVKSDNDNKGKGTSDKKKEKNKKDSAKQDKPKAENKKNKVSK